MRIAYGSLLLVLFLLPRKRNRTIFPPKYTLNVHRDSMTRCWLLCPFINSKSSLLYPFSKPLKISWLIEATQSVAGAAYLAQNQTTIIGIYSHPLKSELLPDAANRCTVTARMPLPYFLFLHKILVPYNIRINYGCNSILPRIKQPPAYRLVRLVLPFDVAALFS